MYGLSRNERFLATVLFFFMTLSMPSLTSCGGGGGGFLPPAVPSVIIELAPYYQGKTTAAGDAYFHVSGDFPSVSYSCTLNGLPVSCAAGSPIHYSGLADKSALVVEVTATDLATGLAGPTAHASAEVDATAPTISGLAFLQVPNNGSALAQVSFTSSDTVAGGTIFTCDIDGNAFACAPGSNPVSGDLLTDGTRTLTISAIDLGGMGNMSIPYTVSADIDLTPPVFNPALTRYPSAPVASTSTIATQIMFGALDMNNPVTYSCALVFPTQEVHIYSPCDGISATDPVFTWANLPNGQFSLVVTAFDFFGNSTGLNPISFSVL